MVKGGLAGPDSLKALYGIALPAIFVGTDAVLLTAAALGSVLKLKQQNEDGESYSGIRTSDVYFVGDYHPESIDTI